jgi:alanine dehydrogenase
VLRAVLEADFLGMMRTGAASGVATRWLARPEAEILGVFGAGWQAEGHIEAIAAVRSLRRVKVFSRNADRLAAFCTKMSDRLKIDVAPASSPEETVRGSDIVSTITTATNPLFDAAWLSPGTHINAAGSNSLIRREVGEDVLKISRPIVVDSVETALKEAGDLLPVLEKGRLNERQLVELGDIIIGRHPGRSKPEEITLFESQGMAIQDISVAVRLEAMAREQGLGVELPYGG